MENEIRIQVLADGNDLAVWNHPDPVTRDVLADRLKRVICGRYQIDAQGRCVLDPMTEVVRPQDRFIGERGGETCISTERNFGDVKVKVEVCKAHK